MLRLLRYEYKNKKMYNRVVDNYVHTLEFVPNCYKTQKICDNPANIFWSARRLQDVLKICLGDVFNTSSA